MSTTPVEVFASPASGPVIDLPPHLIAQLGLAPARPAVLGTGARRMAVRVRRLPADAGNRILVGEAVRRRLALPERLHVHIRRNPDGSLELGPFFGILARRLPHQPPYGEQNRDFRLHMAVGRRHHVAVYAFSPDDLDLKRLAVRARVYDEKARRWVRCTMPLPHVVWNRSYWPGSRNRALLHRTLRQLRRRGAVPFNPGVGTKWHVYRLLAADPELRPHVPDTERYRGIETVLRFARRYPGVYMKPLWGGWGIGIMRIRRVGQGRFQISRTVGRKGRNWSRLVGPAGLQAAVRRLVDGPYLVQQEIPLARLDGRLCDIRVLAQRRADGGWGVTGAVVRVGKPRSVISNLHGGGRAVELRRALAQIFAGRPERVEATVAQIERLALKVVARVEARYGRFGEIGLDFGVDVTGHLWFIEVNSRPGRNSFRLTSPDDLWPATSANPVAYAKRLADFT